MNYANKIAKLLTKKSANTEYEEYSIISKIDPTNKYHLGKPVLCEADAADLKKQTDAHPCKKYEEEKGEQEFRLLIMEYGGIELATYVKTPREFETRFWKKVRNLLDGAELFAKNGLTHRDIKLNNILLNPKSHNLIYIDFGLSRNVADLKKDILNGTKKTHFHWIYPFENGLIEDASKIVKMTGAQFDAYYKKLAKTILEDISSDPSKHVDEIFTLMDNRLAPLNQSKKESMIYDAIDSVRIMGSVEKVVDAMVKSIDTFSLGLALNKTLNAFYDAKKISVPFYKEMHALFAQMTNFNIKERLTDFKIIKAHYEKALKMLKLSPSRKKTAKRIVEN
jgi:serine/threonine protein kinase